MNRTNKHVGYAVAIVASFAVLLIRVALSDILLEQARLMLFVLAVMGAAWCGGLGPGVLATLLSFLLGVYFIVPPTNSMQITTVADGVNAALFVFLGFTISWLCEELHRSRRSEAEKQFRTLADSIAQLVWMACADGNRFWFNRRWNEYSGATLSQLEGDGWQAFCEPTELPRVLKSWHSALATGEPWEETYPIRRKDGEMRWHLVRAEPVRDDRGNITCWFGTSTDIQDRMAIEQALKDADVRKNQFLATLAHELRNPLSPISNAIQLWPRVAHDAAEMDNLRKVMSRQVQQLIRLIDDLMDMARITSGKIKLRRCPIDVGTLIAQAVETVQPMIDSLGHNLTVTVPDQPVYLNGDLSRLTQVFSNILNNAAKYTPCNGAISVLAEREESKAVVRIRDNGPGIQAQLLTSVFDAFRQVDRTLGYSQGGLGIGLTLAKQLVELHGGTIEAHSDGLDQGCEFVVKLPAFPVRVADGDVAETPNQRGAFFRRSVLVVDDLKESANTLTKILRSMGHDATSLYDGEAAIEWILATHPDVVLLDIAMPGLDGYEVARRIRERHDLGAIVLVALTGYGQREDRRRAFKTGFDFHLTKPANIEALQEILLKLPDERRAISEATAQ